MIRSNLRLFVFFGCGDNRSRSRVAVDELNERIIFNRDLRASGEDGVLNESHSAALDGDLGIFAEIRRVYLYRGRVFNDYL